MEIPNENEIRALARGAAAFYPGYPTVFEMGGQTAKYLALDVEAGNGHSGILDYGQSGDCAAGTGSFLDQQAIRLKFDIKEVGAVVAAAAKSAKIAGRCSVFAKSDMIHAQQKGFKPEEILKGLCEAVARNYKSSIVKSKKINLPVLFVGGVAANSGVAEAIRHVFNLKPADFYVPASYAWLPALGAALAEKDSNQNRGFPDLGPLDKWSARQENLSTNSRPLSMKKVISFRDQQPHNQAKTAK